MIGLLVALAGGLGAVARFQSDAAIARLHSLRMPLGTLTINTVGSGLLGLITGYVMFHTGAPEWAAIAGTGFMGGFTT
ncbi:CrcB family protein, partial [Micropruina sp.]|uniref:fluoride efflux transporter FluC n=1 Tax=Micropruina sp. TaxID=2737536 RepID=UPI0026019B89